MSNVSDSSFNLKKEEWLKNLVESRNKTAYDASNGITKLLSFSNRKTIIIPPIPDYGDIERKNQHHILLPSSSKVFKTHINKSGHKKGIEEEIIVSKYFEGIGSGGIYLTGLNIPRSNHGDNKLNSSLPDEKKVHDCLKKYADTQIDGIFIHPRIGLAVVEIKSAGYSKLTPEQDKNWLLKELLERKGVKKQLTKYETLIKELFAAIFDKEIPFPVYKVACVPNADTSQTSVQENIHLLDKSAFNDSGETFQLFWNQMMALENETPNDDFIQFAAVLISLKTAFGLVSTYSSNIISTNYDLLKKQRSASEELDSEKQTKSEKVMQKNKAVYFWLNCEQLSIYEYNAGKHFITGPPGSGKTLLLKARILKNIERCARIFCPDSLTFQYQQFILDNKLQDKVEVHNYTVLMDIAKFHKCEKEGPTFHESIYGYFLSSDIDIYCDEMNSSTFDAENIQKIFDLRPDSDADTFIVGESPEVAIDPVFRLSEHFESAQFLVTSLKTMMRSSLEITEHFLSLNAIAARNNTRVGHSMKFFNVLTISCKNKEEVIQQIITCVYSKSEYYKYSDIAVIFPKYQIGELEIALQDSNIPIKDIEDSPYENAITIVSPNDSRSYEWKLVIVCTNFDQERKLSIAVTRAKIELIILKNEESNEIAIKTNQEDDVDDSFNLGIMHRNGRGIPQYHEESAKWNVKAAEQGVAQAQFNLGVMYQNGEGVPQSDEEAVKWYTKAAEQGYAEAEFNLGFMYRNGRGVLQSDDEAVKWYTKAAERGHAAAKCNLGIMFNNGQGDFESDKEAFKRCTKAAEQGIASDQNSLGEMYYYGRGVSQSDEEAVKWYTKAAEQGDANAQYNLALMYENGLGVSQSDEEALKLYRKAAEQGHARVQYTLGLMYENGQGVPQSKEEAAKWYTKAAEQGNANAQYNLALMYLDGEGVPQCDEEAVKWYRKAAEQGHANVLFNLAHMHHIGRGDLQADKEALKWCTKAAEQGIARYQNSLGEMYYYGRGVPQSDEEAVKWYRKAIEQSDAYAESNLGRLYMYGRGVSQSDEEALKLYRKSAERGNIQAQNNLGFMYQYGRGVSQSDEEAVEWYRKAAEQGDADGQINLGFMYQNGRGLPQSDEEALKWYGKAAQQGDADGENNLGLILYKNIRDVPEADSDALKWFRKAAEQGGVFGQYKL